eukprot:TRINITY_DN18641_c0_g1_i2.p1 TRINITY_DN18641_c0_g1~~TRINITY_DN18641_c0_g1_i2.p1  ORF type:complete len:140 (+),score=10.68 TRINITY_DN18641_c0_g1_i2:118-537(+)
MSSTFDESTNIGVGLIGFGIAFSFMGVILALDRGLLALGNILFVCGITLIIGLKQTIRTFSKREHYKGTFAFTLGFVLVIIGWPLIGMVFEAYACLTLSSAFWPSIKAFLSQIPVLGWLFHSSVLSSLLSSIFQRRGSA